MLEHWLTVLVAAIAAFIAYQQWHTAHDKLRFDLYARRDLRNLIHPGKGARTNKTLDVRSSKLCLAYVYFVMGGILDVNHDRSESADAAIEFPMHPSWTGVFDAFERLQIGGAKDEGQSLIPVAVTLHLASQVAILSEVEDL